MTTETTPSEAQRSINESSPEPNPEEGEPVSLEAWVESRLKPHRFAFLGGLHRSGTTLAFRCLREHPEISGFRDTGAPEDEGQHLQSVMPKAYRHGGPAKFGFSHAMQLDETSSRVTPQSRRRLFDEWSRYWDVRKTWLLEKSPPNLIRARFLQAMLPNTSFIFLIRHPIAVTFATKKWKPRMRLSRFIEHWLVCHERMHADLPHLERSLVMNYEDFVAAPQASLDRIFEFLGLEPIPLPEEVRSDVNQKYFDMWLDAARGMYGGWRHRRIVEQFESRINEFGYTFHGIERPDATGRLERE